MPSTPAPRLRSAARDEVRTWSLSLDQMLPPDHPARAAWAFAEGVDLAPLYAAIKAVEGHPGHPHIDPRLLFALWLYATLDGVGSARELERLCTDHAAYRWLCGGVSVNYHTLAAFRVAHPDLLDSLLTRSVAALVHEGLVTLNRVAMDGVRVRASAGADTFRREPTLGDRLAEAEAQVAALTRQEGEGPGAVTRRQQVARARAARERLDRVQRALAAMPALVAAREGFRRGSGPDARASTTDPEARVMKMADGGFRPAYNVQFATDCDSGVVLTAAATTQGTDNGELGRGADRITTRYGRCPAELLVDYGYARLGDIDRLAADHGAAVYMPLKAAGKWLARGDDPYRPRPKDTPAVAAWRARMGTAEAAEVYKLRASTAEWVNAGCRNRGLYQLPVRGLARVRACALWQALAHNLTRLGGLRRAG